MPSLPPRRPAVVDTASAMQAEHIDDGAGTCRGCLVVYGHLKPYPCEPARWSLAVLQHHLDAGAEAS
jgi:hypothetical protein